MAGLCRFGAAVDIRRADAESSLALAEALAGAQTVVNLTTGVPAGIVRSTQAIYNACIQAGVSRLIHLSSAVVYGDVLTPVTDDDAPVAKHWMPYARAKAESERWLSNRLNSSLEVVVLRPGIVWGPRSPHTLGFARSLLSKRAYLVGGGRGIFNGVYIDNLASAIQAAAAASSDNSGFYNVGDAETVSWREFYEHLGRPLGCDPARLPDVSDQVFPRSLRSTVDTVQNLSAVNALYHSVKGRIPDSLKAAIKTRLEGPYSFDVVASEYPKATVVDRELWHLQRVRHKLPTEKFGRAFGYKTPVSFGEGIRRTLAWLDTLAMVPFQADVR
jgi:nucleoside-diphosphate-sugar epimerase